VITKFISGLSDLGKLLLVIAVITVIVALFVCLLIYPTMSRLSAIDVETAKEEDTIKQDLHFLKYKDKIVKEANAIEPYYIENIPPDNEINTALLKKIEMLATKANVTLVKETTLAPIQETNDLKYPAELECSGKLVDLITFMHLINSSDELIKVVKFNLGSKKTDSDEIKASITVAKMIISKKDLPKPVNSGSSGSGQQSDVSTTKKP
jgi:hypothetical protein